MNLKQKAELFLAEFERRTGARLVGANGPDRVQVYQTLAGLTPDRDAGPLTFGHLRAAFAAEHEEPSDGFPIPALCSIERDGVFPVAEDRKQGEKHYRVTEGFKWSRKYHFAQDITEPMPRGALYPDTDGHYGAPKGSRVLACLPGIVVDIDMRGHMFGVTLKHNTEERGICYSYYLHVDGPAPGLVLGLAVAAGDFIAWMGTSYKRNEPTLRHLHWSFHVASMANTPWTRDRWQWLQSTAINLGGKDWDHHDEGVLGRWRRVFIAL